MNDANAPDREPDDGNEPDRGTNLTLLYGLIVFAMLAAIAIAAFIVLPFYRHR
jgi:hypothetical protein